MRLLVALALSFWPLAAAAQAAAVQAYSTEEGYARPVTDEPTISRIIARFQKDFQKIGIPATVHSCRLMEAVAVGSANSDTSFGAACSITFAKPITSQYLVCDDDFGEGFAFIESSFVDTHDFMAAFIRKTCF